MSTLLVIVAYVLCFAVGWFIGELIVRAFKR